jgi:hypothetical protein
MSQAEESRLDTRIADQSQGGRPYHFRAPTQVERIRMVFALPDGAPLPPVEDSTLTAYFDYLSANLTLPFEAIYCPTSGDVRQLIHYVQIFELADPRQLRKHNLYGLLCKAQNAKETLDLPLAELGVREENPNCQLIDDYAYWFHNWR